MIWYYEEDGVQIGPLTEEEFEQKVMSGLVKQQTMVWNEGMSQWQPYSATMSPVVEVTSKKFCSQCGQSFAENEMLKYENFLICAKCKPTFFQSLKEGAQPIGVGVWRNFSQLVMTKDAQLPDRCTKCNAPAHGLRLKRNLYWHPPAWYLLICAGLLLYAIVALIVRKKASIEIGLCRTHFQKRKAAIAITWSLIAVSIVVTIVASIKAPSLILLAAAIFMGGLIYGILAVQPVTPAKITDHLVWLKGVNQNYLDMLPELPKSMI
jgi:ribosomal protein S27AE